MGLKSDLQTLKTFSDNPYDAKYRPKKEMIKLYIRLQVWLILLLGFSAQVYIIVTGPLSIYWIVIYWRSREYWKDLGWKMRYYYLPTIPVFLFGMYLCIQQYFILGIEWFVNRYMFYI